MSFSDRERFLREFHERSPGCTSKAFGHGRCLEAGVSTYDWLADLADVGTVLDLGCGDGWLLARLAERTPTLELWGVDISRDELALAQQRAPGARLSLARAQALPYEDESADLVLSHMALMLMESPAQVLSDVARVLKPGGQLAAVVGGGPKLGDAFELFIDTLLDTLGPRVRELPALSDPGFRSDEGLRSLFAAESAFDAPLEIRDDYTDCGASFEELWPALMTVYEARLLSRSEAEALERRFRDALGTLADAEHIPCLMAVRRIVATKRA